MSHAMRLCGYIVGNDRPLFLIAGPCVIESESLVIDTAGKLKELTTRLDIPFIFKSSFDKANRSSRASFRGPGLEEGLRILAVVKRQVGVPVRSEEHTSELQSRENLVCRLLLEKKKQTSHRF